MTQRSVQDELENTKRQLEILYEISNAMRTSLQLDEVLYVILTAVTAHAGLGFNRAMLFLVNPHAQQLEGALGIGPDSGEEAKRIWQALDPNRTTLEDLIAAYRHFRDQPPSQLDQLVRGLSIPLQEHAGLLALTALEGMPFEILTDAARAKLHDPFLDSLELVHFVTVPLKARDRVVGVLVADNRFTGKPITNDDLRLLMMCANHAGLAIENSQLYEQTLRLAQTDSLTHLWNHGTFQHLLAEEVARAQRDHTPLALAMLDLDNFKTYNDRVGHQAGDQLLGRVAQVLREVARSSDHVARYGGEEFAVIFPKTTEEEAYQACERIRQRLSQEASSEAITTSIGLALLPQHAMTKDQLIYAADMALLAAKRSGKNQTRLAASQPIPASS